MRPILLSLSVMIGLQATAQFAPGSILSTAVGGPQLRAVDVDGDTDLDLFGLYDGVYFRWYANTDGNGDFSTSLDVITATEPIGRWATADMNGDALDDIVFLDGPETSLWWYENLGGAQFATPVFIAALPAMPIRMLLADLSGEGMPDVVFVIEQEPGDDIAWLPNTAAGFGTLVWIEHDLAGPGASILLGGDIDLTGGIDLLVSDWNQTVFALRNLSGDGSTWLVDTLIAAPGYAYESASTLIDVDNDGDLDLAESGAIALHWAENRIGEGGAWSTFTDHVMEPWTSAGIGVFGHLGCNAAMAVVFVPSFPVLPVHWAAWENTLADFAYRTELTGVPRGNGMVLADFTGDNQDDLVLNEPSGTSWYRNIVQPATTDLQLPLLDTLCMFAPPYPLPSAIPSGGRWSGFNVDQDIFYRSNVNGTDSYALAHAVYEPAGCPVGETTSIYITEQPVISPSLSSPLCSDGTPIQLVSVPLATQWIGVASDGILDPATFTSGVVVAIFTDATGEACATETDPIEVWDALPASIQAAGPFCVTAGPQLIIATAQPPWGVEWSGDIVSWNSSGATFDPGMGAGTYRVVLEAAPTMPFQCPGTDTLVIVVSDFIPTVETQPIEAQCAEGIPIALSGLSSPPGGVWSGPGVQGTSLHPELLGAGNYILTYTYFDPGGCAASAALPVQLVDTVVVSWLVDDLVFCEDDEPVSFVAQPSGGTWSAPLNENGGLDPALLSVGQYPLVYTWAGQNGCLLQNSSNVIERWASTIVTIDPVGVLCDNTSMILITGSPSGAWSGAGSGFGTSTVIEPSALGAGTWPVMLTAANPGECAASTTLDILIEVCTSIQEDHLAAFSLAPNPFTDVIAVELGGVPAERIEVRDAAGRVVLSLRPTGTERVVLDLGREPSGIYMIGVSGADGSQQMVRAVKL
ncbi:MAG: T9SS type A sorting domain-containing protein [Flavobacteriales bacterium]|nr:T9SS type A sorting domain-containing protein [Flavobacteriales bacterium]